MRLLKKFRDDGSDVNEVTALESRSDKDEVIDTMDDDLYETGRTLDQTDAHRDVTYELPSWTSQTITCYMTQMKRFTKERKAWMILALVVMIPVLYIGLSSLVPLPYSHVTNIFLTIPLFALPVISMFLSSNVCGSMLPREFNERTVYLSLPLPMSRSSFYLGKFLAGFSLTLGAIVAAYGVSILLALTVADTDVTYSAAMFTSLGVTMCSVFFFCAFTYMLSARSKRGASMKSMMLLLVAIPMVCIVIYILPSIEQLEPYKGVLTVFGGVIKYVPVFGPDVALNILGLSGMFEFIGMDHLSLYSFASNFSSMKLDVGAASVSVIAVLLGILCLIRGFMRINRRDM